MARLSIGILAHNESDSLGCALRSLGEQGVFLRDHDCEVVVVPNGCNDDTAEIARRELARLAGSLAMSWKVCEVPQPGKSNAWNHFVHEFSRRDAEYLILMDADIQFIETTTLESMVDTLERDADLWVSTDVPMKDIQRKKRKTPLEWLSASVSGTHPATAICGQLYCARADVLRQVWMPPGLPVEDGYLRAMMDTDHFTGTEGGAVRRIRVAPQASHVFEAITDVRSLLRHEKRIVIGTIINMLIFGHLWRNCDAERSAGAFVAKLNQEQPRWVQSLLDARLKSGNWWLIPPAITWRRLAKVRALPAPKAAAQLPVAVVATVLDLLVFVGANADLRRGRGVGFW